MATKPTPFFSFSCPSCGSPGEAYSPTSVLLVCEYCHSTLLRSGEQVDLTGKKSALLEDFSPIQLYTSGTYQGDPFTVIGVLQIQYDRGLWKEWYILFADGTHGWLGDFSGQYVITREIAKPHTLPAFSDLAPGSPDITLGTASFITADIRNAISLKSYARGELPFVLKDNEKVQAADFRYRNHFLTLDYSESASPRLYQGKMVTLENMRCQNLRTPDQIKETAGRLRGERTSFNCPNCGATLAWYPGVAENINCQSCHSEISLQTGQAQLMKTHKMRKAQLASTTLKLGEVAHINGDNWTLIGLMRVQELTAQSAISYIYNNNPRKSYESSQWYEYLLYNPAKGFIWLVESDGSWDLSHSPAIWPEVSSAGSILDPATKKILRRLYDYGGEVVYAAGAFYWQVEPGDMSYYQDYRVDNGKFSAELTKEEFSWSLSKPVSAENLAKWFNRPELLNIVKTKNDSDHPNLALGWIMFIIYIVINLPALLGGGDGSFFVIVISFFVYSMLIGRYQSSDDD